MQPRKEEEGQTTHEGECRGRNRKVKQAKSKNGTKTKRCEECDPCKKENCKECHFCLDMRETHAGV